VTIQMGRTIANPIVFIYSIIDLPSNENLRGTGYTRPAWGRIIRVDSLERCAS